MITLQFHWLSFILGLIVGFAVGYKWGKDVMHDKWMKAYKKMTGQWHEESDLGF